MSLKEINGIRFFTFDIFENIKFLKHCYSTRVGGNSSGVYESLNLGFNRGDNDENVFENYKKIGESVGFNIENIVSVKQVHGKNIKTITKNEPKIGILNQKDLEEYDGIITADFGVCLTTYYADCVPLFFVDEVKKIIGISHAGWRGTVLNIGGDTISKMVSEFGSNLVDIKVGIGPAIGKCCFEVDFPVYDQFLTKLEWTTPYIEKKREKYHIDLKEINRQNIIKAGIDEKNIETSDICTMCNSDLFFSHRKMGAKRGSAAAFMEMVVDK